MANQEQDDEELFDLIGGVGRRVAQGKQDAAADRGGEHATEPGRHIDAGDSGQQPDNGTLR